MKKIFSAFLLMTMMVASVGSFVSCSDIEDAIAKVEGTANDNAEQIESLKSTLATLQTALAAAQSEAAAAKTAADKATQAAAQAQVDAIAAAKDMVEKAIADLQNAHKTDIDAVNAAIKDLEAKLALKADVATVEQIQKTLEIYAGLGIEDKAEAEAVAALLAKIEAGEFATAESVAALVAEVKAINEKLVSVMTLFQAFANQIQSITYVPESLSAYPVAKGYTFGSGNSTVYTDLIVKMTYDVTPKAAAAAVTSETAVFSTVPVTKAAAAEYFKAQVVSADPETGRVVVYAHIPKNNKSAAYNALTDKDANANTTVAVALNVADEEKVSVLLGEEATDVDAGSYVQSAYTGIVANESDPYQSVYTLVTWYNKTKANATVEAINVEVPWNLAASSTRELFSNYEVRLNVDGTYMTVAEASAFFGQEVKIAYGRTAKYYSTATAPKAEITATPASEYNPFTVTGTDLATTAQFANVKKVKDGALVGYNTDVTVNVYTNGATATTQGAVPALTMTANYAVVDKQADIVLGNITKNWSYTEGDNAIVPSQEIDVVEAAGNTDFAAFLTGATWKKNPTATWKYMEDQTEKTATATAVVTAKSKKAVTVTFNNGVAGNGSVATEKAMTYAQAAPTTYTFTGIVNKDKVDYTVTFDVVLAGMPEDKIIDLNNGQPITFPGSLKNAVVIEDLTPATQTLAHIKAVDANCPALASIGRHNDGGLSQLTFVPVFSSIKEGDKAASATVSLFLSHDNKGNDTKEVSTLTIDDLTKYENTITAVFAYDVYGVTFYYTATIVTTKPVVTFKPASAYVTADNKVNLDGTVKFDMTDSATVSSTKFELNKINLRDYVDVTIPEELEGDFELRYTFVDNPLATFKTNGTLDKWNDNPESTTNPKAKFSNANLPAFGTTPAFGTNGIAVAMYEDDFDADVVLDWRTDLREMKVEVALVSTTKIPAVAPSTTPTDDVFDSFVVTLVVPEVIKTFAADEQVKVKYENGKKVSANIVKAITVEDKLGNEVYNPYAATMKQIWNGYRVNKDGTVTDRQADFFKAYGQEVVLPADTAVKAYINGNDVTSQVKPAVDDKGNVTINPETATLTGDVVVEVPVKLTYLYDEYGAQAKTATVQVVFEVE